MKGSSRLDPHIGMKVRQPLIAVGLRIGRACGYLFMDLADSLPQGKGAFQQFSRDPSNSLFRLVSLVLSHGTWNTAQNEEGTQRHGQYFPHHVNLIYDDADASGGSRWQHSQSSEISTFLI
jgi:hypothetical protein